MYNVPININKKGNFQGQASHNTKKPITKPFRPYFVQKSRPKIMASLVLDVKPIHILLTQITVYQKVVFY